MTVRSGWATSGAVAVLLACGADDAAATAAAQDTGRERPRAVQLSPEMSAKLFLAPELRGQWGVTLADCDDTPTDNSGVMLVEAAALRFLDAVSSPTSINRTGSRQWRSIFNQVDDLGRRWEEKTLTLSDNGQLLTIATGTRFQVFRRCGTQK